MDEFKKLNWLWKGCGSTTSNLYKKQFSDNEKDVFFCHLNEIDHIHLLNDYGLRNDLRTENISIRTDPRTGQEITKEWYDHSTVSKTTLFADFPQRSVMTEQQHRSCLNAIKLRADPNGISTNNDRNDDRVYGQLSLERSREKAKFYDFVKSEFYKRNIKNCYVLQQELDKFVTKRWNDAVQRACTANANQYQLQSAIPIGQAGSDDHLAMEHVKTVNETGVVLLVNNNKYRNHVRLSCPFLDHFFANDSAITVPLNESFTQSESIDASISLRTLTKIVTSARIQSIDWNVTFSVKVCDNQRKVIIFDEIQPALSLGCLEKNRLAYEYGIKANVVVPKKKEVFSFETKQFIERIETPLEGYATRQPLEESVASYKVWDYGEYLTKFSPSATANPTFDSNHIRRVWNVKRKSVDCCRLAVDSSQDLCEKLTDGSVKFVNLSLKPEYQCEFGAEQMTLPELISEWCQLRFGPDTITHRVRINAKTGCVTEKKDINIDDVEHDLERLYQVKSETLLGPLLNCIEIIRQFPSDEYLLSHLGKHNAQAMVYVKSNGPSNSSKAIQIADLYKSHQADTAAHLHTIQWNPIDDTIRTSIHTAVMPCAFPHWTKKANGKKRAAQCNDRVRIVEKALRKDREKNEKEQTKQKLIKKTKALRKLEVNRKKKKLLLAKRPKFEGESLDPSELFDERGNINILDLVSCGDDEEKNEQSVERGGVAESVCFETYCRDAAATSDDPSTLD